MDGCRPTRESLKSHHPNWKEKLRQSCLRRVREERALLLWEIRANGRHASNHKEVVESTFWHIVSDELAKIKVSPLGDSHGISNSKNDDTLWEYDHLPSENEELMMEMERMLYKDLREEKIRRELELIEEEDEYLARAVFEHMQINDDQSLKSKIWCPICKRGELKETHHLIHCTDCKLQLDLENDKVNLEFLRERLAEVHMDHLDAGCRALPEFCMETSEAFSLRVKNELLNKISEDEICYFVNQFRLDLRILFCRKLLNIFNFYNVILFLTTIEFLCEYGLHDC